VHDSHRLGLPIEEAAIKLPEVSEKARERVKTGDEGYPSSPPKTPQRP
jgi:hypothetical protein